MFILLLIKDRIAVDKCEIETDVGWYIIDMINSFRSFKWNEERCLRDSLRHAVSRSASFAAGLVVLCIVSALKYLTNLVARRKIYSRGGVGAVSGRNGNLLTTIDQPGCTHTLSYTDFNEAAARKVSNYINESLTRPPFYSSTTTLKIITNAISDNVKGLHIKIGRLSESLYRN